MKITLPLLVGLLLLLVSLALAAGALAQDTPAVRDSTLPERPQMSQIAEGKGAPDGGLLALCRADFDMLVLGANIHRHQSRRRMLQGVVERLLNNTI